MLRKVCVSLVLVATFIMAQQAEARCRRGCRGGRCGGGGCAVSACAGGSCAVR